MAMPHATKGEELSDAGAVNAAHRKGGGLSVRLHSFSTLWVRHAAADQAESGGWRWPGRRLAPSQWFPGTKCAHACTLPQRHWAPCPDGPRGQGRGHCRCGHGSVRGWSPGGRVAEGLEAALEPSPWGRGGWVAEPGLLHKGRPSVGGAGAAESCARGPGSGAPRGRSSGRRSSSGEPGPTKRPAHGAETNPAGRGSSLGAVRKRRERGNISAGRRGLLVAFFQQKQCQCQPPRTGCWLPTAVRAPCPTAALPGLGGPRVSHSFSHKWTWERGFLQVPEPMRVGPGQAQGGLPAAALLTHLVPAVVQVRTGCGKV